MKSTAEINEVASPDYNRYFNKKTGMMMRWGKTPEDDPQFSPFGPEILDLEISQNGCPNGGGKLKCAWCYKGNTNEKPTNMSFDSFKIIFDKMKVNLDSVAFGITGIQTNPDFLKMMKYCRENHVVPNFTLTGIDLTDEIAEEVMKYVGGLAVSVYQTDKNIGYNTIKKFTDLGLSQCNCHMFTSQETLPFIYEVLNDIKADKRLEKLNAIIFLGLKPKGRAKDHFHIVGKEEYAKLVNYCLDNDIKFGFDSCSAPKFEESIRNSDKFNEKQKEYLISMSESCESGIFSAYVDANGNFWPCSFCENVDGIEPINVLNCVNFLDDIWYNEKVVEWRKKLLEGAVNGCRRCPVYKLD